jgi:hypothetical protein
MDAVQRPYPGVELLVWYLVFQPIQAMLPEVNIHNFYSCLLPASFQRRDLRSDKTSKTFGLLNSIHVPINQVSCRHRGI